MTDAPALQDRVALVTGGAQGIGRAITEGLVAAGAAVAVCGRSQPDELADGARFFAADVRDPGEVDDLVAAVVERYGRVDVLVNNAGGSPHAAAATASPQFSTAIVTLNLLAPLHVSTAVNRVMQGQDGGGAIVNLASLRGMGAAPGTAAYGAAKAGLISLTETLAVEWAPRVRVNCISAGLVATEAPAADVGADLPLGRLGRAVEVADAVVWLSSPASAYVTGTNLVLHGGGERPAYLAAITGG